MTAQAQDSEYPAPRSPVREDLPAPAEYVVILCTAPNEAVARDLAARLLDERLAACVTLLPGALSIYRWEGKLEQQQEAQMLIKSHVRHQPALMARVKALHPYQTPELLALPVLSGDADYLSWLNASLR
ncbi:divalent cation tolerance protein CutA [Acerihabitans sp. KWT182]|uniref:Divalent-cation tolerance protein CutA n=1 Tax=Acerihabitans sp. KWT182 TaxID=3157919 RepID=A0AAU7QB42_9GAMM